MSAKREMIPARRSTGDIRPERRKLLLAGGYETSMWFYSPPEGSPKALPVLYVHGIQSHPGWFAGSCASLAAAGHAVFAPTRRGSGDNEAARGDSPGPSVLLADVQAAVGEALRQSGCEKLHLVGVSWGGKLLTAYAALALQREVIASLTLVAPGLAPKVDVGLGTKLAIALALLCCPQRRFDIPLSDVELFTDNTEMREYLNNDPVRLHRATARFLYGSRKFDRIIADCDRDSLPMPVTLILSDRDRIIDNARTRKIVSRLAGDGLDVQTLCGAHTLEFEPDPQPLYNALKTAVRRGES
jgi:alpha-beta hydrolase superfamily lysophospholipase